MKDDTMCKMEMFKENHLFFVLSSGVEWRDNYKLQAYAHTVYRNDQIKQTIKIKL